MLSFRRAIFCSVGALATLALTTGTASASPIQVRTAGCFNCDETGPFKDIAEDASDVDKIAYTFYGVTNSDADIDDASGNGTVSLGMLVRSNENYSQSETGKDFVLQLAFLLPLGLDSAADEFVATIVGTQGQPGDLVFGDEFTRYNFTNESGTGSFDFRVNDIFSLSKNGSAFLTGSIQNAVFTPTGPKVSEVPEPASLLLFGSGLVVAARQFRRRASK
jgi:hypothetical protein